MTKETYDKSIDTRELQLIGFGSKLNHFGIVGYLLIFPTTILCFHLVDFIRGNSLSYRDGEFWFVIIPVILAIILFGIQKRRLKYKVIETHLTKAQIKELIIEVANELKWERGSFSAQAYISRTNPGFFSGSWGEQITILFGENYVYVNSICDLNKRSSVVSCGRNKRNENTLVERIKKANRFVEKEVI